LYLDADDGFGGHQVAVTAQAVADFAAPSLSNVQVAFVDDAKVKVTIVGSVRQAEQVLDTLARAHSAGALVVHTLVEQPLRDLLLQQARIRIKAMDLTGPLFDG
jgi:hypothetical protein